MSLKLNSISAVMATAEAGVFIVHCNMTDNDGDTYDAEYGSRPEDPYGLNPTIRQWIEDNPGFPIQPYVPPTAEELRPHMPKLTARQFRLGFVQAGHAIASIDAAIEAISDPTTKEMARIEWEYATTFNRVHPLISQIATGLGLTEEQIDSMWAAAVNL